jgi:hypothetical protein
VEGESRKAEGGRQKVEGKQKGGRRAGGTGRRRAESIVSIKAGSGKRDTISLQPFVGTLGYFIVPSIH